MKKIFIKLMLSFLFLYLYFPPAVFAKGCVDATTGPCINGAQRTTYTCVQSDDLTPCGAAGYDPTEECSNFGTSWYQEDRCSCNPNAWSSWSACTNTCGGGTQTRTNDCNTTQSQTCNTQVCPTIVPTSTPVLPIPTLTSTPTPIPPSPTISVISCPRKAEGDANCDGKIDEADFRLWQQQFDTMVPAQPANQNANFACTEGNATTYFVDLIDFEIWRRNTISGLR